MTGLTTSYYLNSPLENRRKNTKWKQQLYENIYSTHIATCAWHKLNHVVLRVLWKIDVHLISTLVNKSLYYYTKPS